MILIEEEVLNSFIERYVKQFWMFSQLLTEYEDYEAVHEALKAVSYTHLTLPTNREV